MKDERRPATSASPTTSTKQKSSRGKRRVARTAGTDYGRSALESALVDMERVTERSHGLFRISASLGNLIAGGQLEEIYVTSALMGVTRARGMNHRHAERTIERGIDRGKGTPRTPTRPAVYNRNDAIVAIAIWWEGVGQARWTEQTSATDLRVLAGFGLIAQGAGKIRFTASHRQVAEESGVSVWSVRKAIDRGLQGYVQQVGYGNRIQGTANKWLLVTKRARITHSPSLGKELRLGSSCARAIDLPDHDSWDRWPNGWRVYNILHTDEAMTARDISEAIGRPAGSIRRILNRLRDQQLARRVEEGKWIALPPPEDVLDGGFRRRAREDRHRDQRLLWAQKRAVLIEQKRSNTESGNASTLPIAETFKTEKELSSVVDNSPTWEQIKRKALPKRAAR